VILATRPGHCTQALSALDASQLFTAPVGDRTEFMAGVLLHGPVPMSRGQAAASPKRSASSVAAPRPVRQIVENDDLGEVIS
jgi:hypothetical protein